MQRQADSTVGKTFRQLLKVQGEAVERHGIYGLSGDQIAFFDELGTKDGPYTIAIDTSSKKLKISMRQVNVELMLEKEYREQQKAHSGK